MAVDLSDIKYIKRFVIGNEDPQHLKSNEEIELQMQKLNEALNNPPKGKILTIETNFALLVFNGHQLKLEWTAYHVGFTRKLMAGEHE